MKTGEAERWLQQQVSNLYDSQESSAIAAWVLQKVTGLTRMDRLAQREQPLVAAQWHQLTALVQRLQQHEPVQYVLAESYFRNLKLYVDKNVLIPRPETEELIEWIRADLKASGKDVFENKIGQADKTRSLKILDIGTGSGCIALALKSEAPKAEVWGCDKSDAALTVARRNGAALDIRVDFQQVDFLDAAQWNGLPRVDLIVSNPPYISLREQAAMSPNVVQHEPHAALFVPDENPLVFYEAIARFGKEKLYNGGAVYVEIHEEQGEAVVQLFQKAMYKNVELRKDMQGKDRMVKAVLRE